MWQSVEVGCFELECCLRQGDIWHRPLYVHMRTRSGLSVGSASILAEELRKFVGVKVQWGSNSSSGVPILCTQAFFLSYKQTSTLHILSKVRVIGTKNASCHSSFLGICYFITFIIIEQLEFIMKPSGTRHFYLGGNFLFIILKALSYLREFISWPE